MLSKVFDEQLCVKQDYIYEVKDHLGNVRVTYNEVPKFGDKKYTMTAETEQHYLADRDDYLNFANTNYWRSIDKSYRGRFSLKISPVDNQPVPQPQKVSMFRLPIRKGEKWSAKVWAFKALNSGMKSPPPPTGGVFTPLRKTPAPLGRAGVGLFTFVTPPLIATQTPENQGLSFNVLAAVPIVKSIFKRKSPLTPEGGIVTSKTPPSGVGGLDERVGQTNTVVRVHIGMVIKGNLRRKRKNGIVLS